MQTVTMSAGFFVTFSNHLPCNLKMKNTYTKYEKKMKKKKKEGFQLRRFINISFVSIFPTVILFKSCFYPRNGFM